jgi:hypothetical protein
VLAYFKKSVKVLLERPPITFGFIAVYDISRPVKYGATTFSITTFSITTFSIVIHRIALLNITARRTMSLK